MTIAYRSAELTCSSCSSLAVDQPCPAMCDPRFVRSTWSSSFKNADSAGIIWHEDWAAIMHAQIGRILARPDARTIIAYENTAPTMKYGFISGDVEDPLRPIVFYVYVKEPYRNGGFARGLFAALGVDPEKPFEYACRTAMVSKLARKIPSARWNPRVVRYPEGQRRIP